MRKLFRGFINKLSVAFLLCGISACCAATGKNSCKPVRVYIGLSDSSGDSMGLFMEYQNGGNEILAGILGGYSNILSMYPNYRPMLCEDSGFKDLCAAIEGLRKVQEKLESAEENYDFVDEWVEETRFAEKLTKMKKERARLWNEVDKHLNLIN